MARRSWRESSLRTRKLLFFGAFLSVFGFGWVAASERVPDLISVAAAVPMGLALIVQFIVGVDVYNEATGRKAKS